MKGLGLGFAEGIGNGRKMIGDRDDRMVVRLGLGLSEIGFVEDQAQRREGRGGIPFCEVEGLGDRSFGGDRLELAGAREVTVCPVDEGGDRVLGDGECCHG